MVWIKQHPRLIFHSPLITLFLKMCLFIIFWSLWIKRLNNCTCYSYTRLSMRRLLVRLMVEIFQFLRLKLLTTWRLFVLHDYFVLCEKLFMPIINALRLILYILTLLSTFSMLFSRTSPLVLVIPRSSPSQHGPPPDFSSEFFLLVIATTISSLLVVCICLSSVILQGFMGYGSGTKSLGLE